MRIIRTTYYACGTYGYDDRGGMPYHRFDIIQVSIKFARLQLIIIHSVGNQYDMIPYWTRPSDFHCLSTYFTCI